MVNNRLKLNQRAGAYADFTQVKTCNLEPNIHEYKAPCGSLTDNQFGFKDIVGYYSGGRHGRQSKKQSRRGSIKNQRLHHNQVGGKTKKELEEELRQLEAWYSNAMDDPYAPQQAGPTNHYKAQKQILLTQILEAARKEEQGIPEAAAALAQKEAKDARDAAYAAKCALEQQERMEYARQNPLTWRNNPKYAGGCGATKADCMGNSIANMGDMTHLTTASEQAWFNRNTYGAPSSTNVLSQQGGKNKKSNQRSKKQELRQLSKKQELRQLRKKQ